MQERKCPVSHLGQLGKHWAWGQVGHQGAATLHSPPPGACCPHLPQVQAGRDTTAPFVDGCSLLSVGPRAGRQREPNRLPTMTRQCPSSVGCLELWTRDSRQPFQVAGVIPILRDKEIFEEGKHPDQAHTAIDCPTSWRVSQRMAVRVTCQAAGPKPHLASHPSNDNPHRVPGVEPSD
ncbi:uncharacterized protein LOC125965210 isoform X3 [Orcinus orca]|uniref:uncharacterized protein LOC125965210 isoform X3 n=1 Tax=Orcinus orca TaxID=9733 RepID=UPI0021124216|nr:uncharacterized protein LOC125965210 isoform X3 [Orcinus orca]